MKKTIQISYAVFALMAMSFAACTQNEDITPFLSGQEINATFSIRGVQTRVNTLDYYGNQWEDGNQINVQVFTDETAPGDSIHLTYDGSNKTWSRDSRFYWLDKSGKHTILAVYPSEYKFDKFDLPKNQDSSEALKSADLINGYWHEDPDRYDRYVDIPMKHRMALVMITYHVGTADYPNMDISEPQVYSKHMNVTFKIDQEQGKLVMDQPTGNPDWVTACKHDTNKFSAIVIPGSYATGEIFLKFELDNKNFFVKMKTPTEFEEGYRYTYELNIGKNKVELTQISSDDLAGWDNDNEEELK